MYLFSVKTSLMYLNCLFCIHKNIVDTFKPNVVLLNKSFKKGLAGFKKLFKSACHSDRLGGLYGVDWFRQLFSWTWVQIPTTPPNGAESFVNTS